MSKTPKVDQVYELLKKKIISNELEPMTPLSERKLSAQLDVSRTPMHLAIEHLKKDKFVNHTVEFGAYVAPITYELIQEIYEIKEVLEGLSAKLCAQTLSPQEKDELTEIFTNLTNALENSRFQETTDYDIEFHTFIVMHCKNYMLLDMVHNVFDHYARITKLTHYTVEWRQIVLQQHRDIFNAIINGKSEDAENFMKAHIASAKNLQLSQISRI